MSETSESAPYDEQYLPDLLPLYYNRIFPAKEFVRWISYGDENKLLNREFSMTLLDDVYIRHMTFNSAESLTRKLIEKRPGKVDLGAIYNKPPMQAKADLEPVEREFVIDIDMSDYDVVRTCCSNTDVCNKCFKFVRIATQVLNQTLKKDFGFHQLLWVFSGRRGIHCWVCDKGARELDNSVRDAMVGYMSREQVQLDKRLLWKRAGVTMLNRYEARICHIVDPYFMEILEEQDLLATELGVNRIVALVDPDLRKTFKPALMSLQTTRERWTEFVRIHERLMEEGHPKRQPNLIQFTMIQFCYPRIDRCVSQSITHLLKIPFSVHPKTGKISVPLNPYKIDEFELDAVPNITLLLKEINDYDQMPNQQQGATASKQKVADATKTSLSKSLKVFSRFINKIESARASKNASN